MKQSQCQPAMCPEDFKITELTYAYLRFRMPKQYEGGSTWQECASVIEYDRRAPGPAPGMGVTIGQARG